MAGGGFLVDFSHVTASDVTLGLCSGAILLFALGFAAALQHCDRADARTRRAWAAFAAGRYQQVLRLLPHPATPEEQRLVEAARHELCRRRYPPPWLF